MKKALLIIMVVLELFPITGRAEDIYYKQASTCVIDRGNPQRTGVYKATPIRKTPEWERTSPVENDIQFNTFICANNIIVLSNMFELSSINIGNMEVNLSPVDFTIPENEFVQHNTPLFYKDILYIPTYYIPYKDSKSRSLPSLIGFDPATNKIVKQYITGKKEGYVGSPLIYNDVIYVVTENGLSALDIKTGSTLWNLPDFKSSWGKLSTDGNALYASNNNHDINAINLKDGKILWIAHIKKQVPGYITISKNFAYFNTEGNIYALNKLTGDAIWKSSYKNYSSDIALHDKKIIAGSKKEVFALDALTGKLLWKTNKFGATTSPVIVRNIGYVAAYSILTAFDIHSGSVLWQYGLNGYEGGKLNPLPVGDKLITAGGSKNASWTYILK